MEVLETCFTENDILKLIRFIYVIVKAACCWFKEYIKTMIIKVGFNKCNNYPCLLYIVNVIGAATVIVYLITC